MKICIITHTFPRNKEDASAAFMEAFANGLVEAGNEVFVITPFDSQFNRKKDKFKINIYKYIWPEYLHTLGYSRTMQADVKLKHRAYLLIPFMVIFGSMRLIRTIKKNNIDVINAHWILPNGLIALIASFLTGTPYVVTIPGTDTLIAKKNIVFSLLSSLILARSAVVVSNNKWMLDKMVKGSKHKQAKVLSYPVDVSAFKPATKGLAKYRKKHNLKGKLVILAVGRLVYKKGFKYLIKAMPDIIKKHPNATLLIGGDGDLMQNLKALARKLGIEKNVIFLGNINRNEIIYYYNLADIMVAPSIVDKKGNADGGPVVSFESMACSKPQVVSNILGVANYIEDGIGGYKVPPKSTKALKGAIIKLLSSRRLRLRMGQANRKLATTNFSTKSVGEKYTEIFENVV